MKHISQQWRKCFAIRKILRFSITVSWLHEILINSNASMTKRAEYKPEISSILPNDIELSPKAFAICEFSLVFSSEIMSIVTYLFLVLLNEVLGTGSGGKEHVHFKIHVPEIIKHHIHTKTIFVHVHKAAPKRKKKVPNTYHKEEHRDWSSWSSYDHHSNYEDKDNDNDTKHHVKNDHHANDDRLKNYKSSYDNLPVYFDHNDAQRYSSPDNHKDHRQKDRLEHYPHKNTYLSQSNSVNSQDQRFRNDKGTMEHSHSPHYAVHEDFKELPANDLDSFDYNYEEGSKKGAHSETGHRYADQLTKFHDDKHEEGEDETGERFKEDFDGRTNAGRYFVDDVKYEDDEDKREKDEDSP